MGNSDPKCDFPQVATAPGATTFVFGWLVGLPVKTIVNHQPKAQSMKIPRRHRWGGSTRGALVLAALLLCGCATLPTVPSSAATVALALQVTAAVDATGTAAMQTIEAVLAATTTPVAPSATATPNAPTPTVVLPSSTATPDLIATAVQQAINQTAVAATLTALAPSATPAFTNTPPPIVTLPAPATATPVRDIPPAATPTPVPPPAPVAPATGVIEILDPKWSESRQGWQTVRWRYSGQLQPGQGFDLILWYVLEERKRGVTDAKSIAEKLERHPNGEYSVLVNLSAAEAVKQYCDAKYLLAVTVVQLDPYQRIGPESDGVQIQVAPLPGGPC